MFFQTLLQHVISSANVTLVKALFENKFTNMDYELSVRNECNKVGPQLPCMTDSAEPFRFHIAHLIPYSTSPACVGIVNILRENGYDVSKIITIPHQKIVPAPLWSKLDLSAPSVRTMFEGYKKPIKWFDKTGDGETSKPYYFYFHIKHKSYATKVYSYKNRKYYEISKEFPFSICLMNESIKIVLRNMRNVSNNNY